MFDDVNGHQLGRRDFLRGSLALLAFQTLGGKVSAATLGAPTNPMILSADFSASVVDAAIKQLMWCPPVTGTRPLGGALQRVMLGLTAKLHTDAATREAAASRAIEHATWMLQSNMDNYRPNGDQWLWDEFHHGTTPTIAFFTLCRRVPLIWDRASADLRSRIDAYIGIGAWGINMFVNPDHNDGQNEVTFGRDNRKSINCNQNTAYRSLPLVMAYYGGLSGYNAHLATYSPAKVDALVGPSGYNWQQANNFRDSAVKASMDTGVPLTGISGTALGQTNRYHSQGARRALTSFKGRRVPLDRNSAAYTNWVVGSAIANPTPAQVFIRNEVEGNYALFVRDQGCSEGSSTAACGEKYGRIRPGFSSPNLGEPVMAQEYHITARSTQHYAMTTVGDMTIPVLATLMALGWWTSPDPTLDKASDQIRKGLEVVRYREGNWFSPGLVHL